MATGTMRFYSICQNGQVEFTYVIPNDYPEVLTAGNPHFSRPMKTLYLLHGVTGNHSDWEYNGAAEDLALKYNLAVIMITAGNNFYLNRKATGCQYENYTGKEIVEYTRKVFGLSERREDTLIGGLSMGGFGALHTALAYPDTFGGVVALSSALIIHTISKMKPGDSDDLANYEYYREVFGELETLPESDKNPEVLYKKLVNEGRNIPEIYMAIGTEDFLYNENQIMRKFLTEEKADFKYEEGPGIHDWNFWNKYIFNGMEYILEKIGQR